MDQIDLLKFIADIFERLGVKYMLVGSYASMYYGEMRNTNDIDIVADLQDKDIQGFIKHFPSNEFYLSEDAIKEALKYRSQFNIIHSGSRSKIDVMIPKKDRFSEMELENRIKVKAFGYEVFVAKPEYVILKKLEYYQEGESEKHLRDIASMFRISGSKIDFNLIKEWAMKLGLTETWDDFLEKYQAKLKKNE